MDTVRTAAETGRWTAFGVTRRVLAAEWTPRLGVILGAALIFALLAMEYFKEYPYYGPKHLLAICVGAALMAAGAVLEVVSGRRSAADALRFWAVGGYVALIVLALHTYTIESRSFTEFVAPLALFGFIINHYLPVALRRPFFLLLCFAGIFAVFGFISLPAALGLIFGGLALVGICHLPIPMWARIAVLVACAAGLAAVRVGWFYAGWTAVIVTVLPSMFMFRLPIYLYDTASNKGPKDVWGRLSYFFMFPNLVFPFFPVVDFATFGRSYYNDEAIKIYQRGATFMLRGLIHLLLYRVIYTYFVLAPDDVHDPASFLQQIVSNFGLYFRISGMFHLIAGLLLLFGFNLHETHSQFYFSNSFLDFWRRINIYWKDFMQKMFFNPSYMRFKRLGASHMTSVALAMGVVFFATWALHAYQWFWLTGTLQITLPDILFWTILLVLLVAQTFYEARPRKASLRLGALGSQLHLIVRTACTFLTICLLWSFWTSSSVSDWMALVTQSGLMPALVRPGTASATAWLMTFATVAFAIVMVAIAAGLPFAPAPPALGSRARSKESHLSDSLPLGVALVSGLLALQVPAINSALGSGVRTVAEEIRVHNLNGADEVTMERGYYEGLATEKLSPELWTFLSTRAHLPDPGEDAPRGMRLRNDYLGRDYFPSSTYRNNGVNTPINRWGFPDLDYELDKPPGTYRIVLVEASRANGAGVAHSDRFETLLEQRLNSEAATGKYAHYEILNFSGDGYAPLERLLFFEEKQALRFSPDAVLYVAGIRDTEFYHHAQMIRRGVPMPYEFLEKIHKQAGVDRSMSEAEIIRRLRPYRYEFVSAIYRRLAEELREHGVKGIWIYVPLVSKVRENWDEVAKLRQLAQEAGFITADVGKLFAGMNDWSTYRISRWDSHPNERGHVVIAKALYERLKALHDDGQIDLGLGRHGAGH